MDFSAPDNSNIRKAIVNKIIPSEYGLVLSSLSSASMLVIFFRLTEYSTNETGITTPAIIENRTMKNIFKPVISRVSDR